MSTATRGVFGLVFDGPKLLLSERQDGKGWNLPGGGKNASETDPATLKRECLEETGLHTEVMCMVGEELVFGVDTAVAYLCVVIGGKLGVTSEAKRHRYATAQEVRQGYYLEGEEKISLKLVGPDGRLGRTGRMVWDGFTITLEGQVRKGKKDPTKRGIYVEDQALLVEQISAEEQRFWRRLDPYGPGGLMAKK